MQKRTMASIIKKIEKHKDAIAKHRDELRSLLDELNATEESATDAINSLEYAVDQLSETL